MKATSRPFTRVATLGLAGHVSFELAAGVGLPLASVIGPVPAAGLCAASTASTFRAEERRPRNRGPLVRTGERLRHRRCDIALLRLAEAAYGLPWLADCEGLGPELMPAILYVSGSAALAGLLRESRGGRLLGGALAVGIVPVLMAGQRWEFRRLQDQAQRRPQWSSVVEPSAGQFPRASRMRSRARSMIAVGGPSSRLAVALSSPGCG